MATFLNLFSGGSILIATIPGILSWRLRFQKDDKLLSKAKRTHIESKIQDLAHKLNINKPIELIEKKGLICSAQAQGVAIFSGRAAIAIDPELAENMPAAELEFLLAHELSHIKANDLMWMGVVPGVVGVITTVAMSILFPPSVSYFSPIVKAALMISSPSAAVGLSVSLIAFVIYSKWREECADKLAFSICSPKAKKAAPRFFDRIRTFHIAHRNDKEGSCLSKLWRKFLITLDGDFRFDFFHPSLKTRINYLT